MSMETDYVLLVCIYLAIGLVIGYFAYTQMSEKICQRSRTLKSVEMGIGWPLVVLLIIALLIEDFFDWVFGVEILDDEDEEY